MTLVGRLEECSRLDELLESARRGLGGVIVVRGEAGIGKTALIEHAIRKGEDFLLVRMTGVEAEHDIAFAALHRLLTPILHQIERLPPPQRDALNSALGLAAGPPADRFLLGLGVLSLAANAVRAVHRLLCVIDDAQWIDRESLDALAFWGRRIHADGTALIFGEREEPGASSLLNGFPVIRVEGLTQSDSRQLLNSVSLVGLDPDVADRIVADMGGNPLALVELGQELDTGQLIGAAATPHPLAVGRRLEERFVRQVRTLPVQTQMMLLLCAADSTGDAALLWKSASLAGLQADAAELAEVEGLLILDAQVKFRHPLIRSAVYSNARPADRRAVHRALAGATDPVRNADRRAWHLAAATIGRDEEVAILLERCALQAGERGAHSARVALLSRAAELTPDPGRAAGRRFAAAAAALDAGAPFQAQALIALATPDLADPVDLAAARRLEGAAWTRLGRPRIAAPILLAAAVATIDSNPSLARAVLLETLEAAFLAGGSDMADAAEHDVIQSAAIVARGCVDGAGAVTDALLDAFAALVVAGFESAAPLLRHAIAAMRRDDVKPEDLIRWCRFASDATRVLWDHDGHDALTARLADVTRRRGALSYLASTLQSRASSELWQGNFDAADSYIAQAIDVSSAAGGDATAGELMGLSILAYRGRDAEARAKAARVMELAAQTGAGLAAIVARSALVVLDLGMGNYRDALSNAQRVFADDPIPFGNEVLANMVEAAIRSGDRSSAQAALSRLADRAPASGTPWAMGLVARSQALMADDDGEDLYRSAIEILGGTRQLVELARGHLLYGEWLRRQNRRIDARRELRIADDMFSAMGAAAFARRSAAELLATGEHARKRSVETETDLTPREIHVATLASAGATNTEIAAQLFLSPSTVEYHLRKVFRKLAVTSRRQLKTALQKG